ncbi:hypothetical protein BpHYR1_038065 [Brachionus plicatilis]|uniref:Uncharacterized protein n=1 Tax=Brachionus plicatilis TaxID=10195 RepID=A0A3M7R4S9_BRAPC|nr:hypothetical protein BpHYR1_038065 [Brachionus plicatilis]
MNFKQSLVSIRFSLGFQTIFRLKNQKYFFKSKSTFLFLFVCINFTIILCFIVEYIISKFMSYKN